jgi:S-adenosylhomocysteine hydrolase
MEEYSLKDGRNLYLLAEGRLVNQPQQKVTSK